MTAKDDPRLDGRHPEFARMSLRPGIGRSAMDEVASELMRFNLDLSQADVPSGLRHGKKVLPLGRYLQRELRKLVGKDEKTPEAVTKKLDEEMLSLRWAARDNKTSFKEEVIKAGEAKRLRMLARQKIFNRRKSL